MAATFAIHGTIIHSTSLSTIQIHPNTLLLIINGKITHLLPNTPSSAIPTILTQSGHNPYLIPINHLSPTQFLIPGFVDTHNHAPQWTQRGLGRSLPLLSWLENVTFAHESRFSDPDYSRKTYTSCVTGFLKQGITTAAYYGSRHVEATRILASVCVEMGQRAFVGRVCMNRHAPGWYVDEGVEGVSETRDIIEDIRKLDAGRELVRAIITPRFGITCTDDVLSGLGDLAKANKDIPIQTHFNEAQDEISFTRTLFPDKTETELYERFGLLGCRSILAHAIYLEQDEMDRIKQLECGIAHCPIPNVTMGTFMIAPICEYLRRGIKVGLGTDSGGGYSSSMLEVMKQAFIVSTARKTATKGADEELSLAECFYLATLGGARVMGMEERIGNFGVGKEFDAVVVDSGVDGVMCTVEEGDGVEGVLEKFLMTGDDRNMVRVYVGGRIVKEVK